MIICNNCGLDVPEGNRFCQDCGTQVSLVAGRATLPKPVSPLPPPTLPLLPPTLPVSPIPTPKQQRSNSFLVVVLAVALAASGVIIFMLVKNKDTKKPDDSIVQVSPTPSPQPTLVAIAPTPICAKLRM